MTATPKKPRQQVVQGHYELHPSQEQQLARLRDEGLVWTAEGRWHVLDKLLDHVVVGIWRRCVTYGVGNRPSCVAPRERAAILYAEIQRRGLTIAPRTALKSGLPLTCGVRGCGRPAHTVASYHQYCDRHKGLGQRMNLLRAAAANAAMDAKQRRYAPRDP